MLKRCLTVAGSDSGGGAGIEADLKTFAATGTYGTVAVTAVTAQNTFEVRGIHAVPAKLVAQQIEAVADDIGIDAVKTGMLATAEIVEVVAARIRDLGLPKLVVDPVMISKSKNRLLAEDAIEALKRYLLPLATVVTPNLEEAEVLSGKSINGLPEMMDVAKTLHKLGSRYVIVKGGHLATEILYDVLYDGQDYYVFPHHRIHTSSTHGTGCTFSAALASYLAQGDDIYVATFKAQRFIRHALANSLELGHGSGPTNHLAKLYEHSSKYQVWTRFREILSFLHRTRVHARMSLSLQFSMLAYPFCSPDDVCSLPGPIVVSDGYFHVTGVPSFGRPTPEGDVLLTLARKGLHFEGAWLLPAALAGAVRQSGCTEVSDCPSFSPKAEASFAYYKICSESKEVCLLGQDAIALAVRLTKILNKI